MSVASPPAATEQRAALTRELSEFLIELSIGVHRYAMYPSDHPSLEPATAKVHGGLTVLLSDRNGLSIGVARNQLIIQGVATDRKHPVLSDLARRLHAHQLGALFFGRGVTLIEVRDLLETLSIEAEREGEPIGLLPKDQLPAWDHIRLFPIGYDQLRMQTGEGEEAEPDRAVQLWLGLAQAAMASQEGEALVDPEDARALAKIIDAHGRESDYDKVIVDYLLQLAEELKVSKSGEADATREKVSRLVQAMAPETLDRMMGMVGSDARMRRFVLDSNQGLAADAVVKILESAASGTRQTISSSLTRLLSKLAAHSEGGSEQARPLADAALRENVESLISDWELVDPNPESYTLLLDRMSHATPLFSLPAEGEETLAGAARILHTALEVDAYGPTLQKAISELLDEGEMGYILKALDDAPEGNAVAIRLREQLTTPFQLKRFLSGGDVDEKGLRMLVERIGPASIDTLLEFLTDSESRATRRKVFDCLAGMGVIAGEKALEWLKDPRWFVQRNMLALIQKMDVVPDAFLPAPYLGHPDPRVRREAFPLALRMPRFQEKALAMGLADSDERLVRMALIEVQKGIPETILPILVARVIQGKAQSAEIRAIGIRALAASRSPLALETLLHACAGGKSLFGKERIAPKDPVVLSALTVLHACWSDSPPARQLLASALASKDPEIRRAAEGGTR